MINSNDISATINSLATEGYTVTEQDCTYLILCDTISDRKYAQSLAYIGKSKPANPKAMTALAERLKPFGIGAKDTISKDENREELLKLLKEIEQAERDGNIEPKDAIKLKSDIRLKLQTKFDIEEGEEDKRIVVVPQKHDTVCKYTHRECSLMPSKAACMEYYGLIDPLQ